MWAKVLAWLKQWGLALGLFLVTVLTLGGYALKQKKRGDQMEGRWRDEQAERKAERDEAQARHAAELAFKDAERHRAMTEAAERAAAQARHDERIRLINEDEARREAAEKQGALDLEGNRRIDEGLL